MDIMKAVITSGYGSEDVLSIGNIDKPNINDNEILIKVHACSVNPIDWKLRGGHMKIMSGLKPPKVLGGDFAGIVEEIGKKITHFNIGDEVWGQRNASIGGSYAEFIKVEENNISLKPKNFDFNQAASIPLAGLTAYQSLVYKGKVKSGDKILINGSSGGVGTIAIQIGKNLGCHVTGVCSTNNIELAKNLGCDKVIDYKNEDVLKLNDKFDAIFDFVGNLSLATAKHILKSTGVFTTAVPSVSLFMFGGLLNKFKSQKAEGILINSSRKNLDAMRKMAEENKLVPTIEKVYPLDQVQEAHKKSESGRVVGKVIMSVID